MYRLWYRRPIKFIASFEAHTISCIRERALLQVLQVFNMTSLETEPFLREGSLLMLLLLEFEVYTWWGCRFVCRDVNTSQYWCSCARCPRLPFENYSSDPRLTAGRLVDNYGRGEVDRRGSWEPARGLKSFSSDRDLFNNRQTVTLQGGIIA